MLNLILIFILALLVPEIIKTHGIDHPIKNKRRVYVKVDKVDNLFHLPRGQPESGAYIINDPNKIPRNKGEPNLRATIINKKFPPRNKGEPTQNSS